MTFQNAFSGNINQGEEYRVAKRNEEARIKKEEEERFQRLYQIGRKKPGES